MMGGEVQRGRGGDSRKNVHLISTSEQTSSASNAHNCFYGRSKPGENALLAGGEREEGGRQAARHQPANDANYTNQLQQSLYTCEHTSAVLKYTHSTRRRGCTGRGRGRGYGEG